jgi:hypothetical protein
VNHNLGFFSDPLLIFQTSVRARTHFFIFWFSFVPLSAQLLASPWSQRSVIWTLPSLAESVTNGTKVTRTSGGPQSCKSLCRRTLYSLCHQLRSTGSMEGPPYHRRRLRSNPYHRRRFQSTKSMDGRPYHQGLRSTSLHEERDDRGSSRPRCLLFHCHRSGTTTTSPRTETCFQPCCFEIRSIILAICRQ